MVRDPLIDAAAALIRQHPGMDPARAYQLALEDDPDLYTHNTPDGSEGSGGRRGPAVLPPAGQRHYSELSVAERAREPLCRLRPGEALGNRTGVHKLGTDGGMFVLEGS